jgi:intracellular septation protein
MAPASPSKPKSQAVALIFGGLLPVIAFTVIEDQHGPLWGTVAGMTFGIGEIIFEKVKFNKVSQITWLANTLILGLGLISIFSQDGIWFKLQPALLELFFSLLLIGSVVMKKPFLLMMAEKQGTVLNEKVKPLMIGLTFRLGLFFLAQAALATWAAFSWTTAQWAFLKGFGLIIFFFIYMGFEFLYIRRTVRREMQWP